MGRHNREDFLNRCGQLYGFPKTLQHSHELLSLLEEGYREIWGFFKYKPLHSGPVYMIQQPDSELWFRNRIEPLYHEDPRDLVWLVYLEFAFVTRFLFKNLTDHERLPPDMFRESEAFPETPRQWVSRHIKCLELFDTGSAEGMLTVAEDLMTDASEFVDRGFYIR